MQRGISMCKFLNVIIWFQNIVDRWASDHEEQAKGTFVDGLAIMPNVIPKLCGYLIVQVPLHKGVHKELIIILF